VVHHQAQDEACKPKDGGQESKRFRCTPAGALVAEMLDAIPRKSRATVGLVEPIQQDGEGCKPARAEDEVGGVMKHVMSEWKHPEEAEQEGDDGEDQGVDLTTKRLAIPSMGLVVQVELVRHDAENDSSEEELAQAKEEGQQACENHLGGKAMMVLSSRRGFQSGRFGY